MNLSAIKPVLAKLEKHIAKSVKNDSHNLKALIIADVLIDSYGNAVDYSNLSKNKKLPEKERNFLKSYKIANAVLSSVGEILAGFLFLNEKSQNFISNKLFGNLKNANPTVFDKYSRGLKAFSTIVLATVVVKRLIVPFLVIPAASTMEKFSSGPKQGIDFKS